MFTQYKMLPCQSAVLRQRVSEVSAQNNILICVLTLSRINVKLGGINTIPDPAHVRYLTDPANPTIVMGT